MVLTASYLDDHALDGVTLSLAVGAEVKPGWDISKATTFNMFATRAAVAQQKPFFGSTLFAKIADDIICRDTGVTYQQCRGQQAGRPDIPKALRLSRLCGEDRACIANCVCSEA